MAPMTSVCPLNGCGRRLHLKLAGPDAKRIPNEFYYNCFNKKVHAKDHWQTVPEYLVPLEGRPLARTPSVSPPPDLGTKAICVHPGCSVSGKLSRNCRRTMCKAHCIAAGGCNGISTHKVVALVAHPGAAVHVPRAPESTLMALAAAPPITPQASELPMPSRIYADAKDVPDFNTLQAMPSVVQQQQRLLDAYQQAHHAPGPSRTAAAPAPGPSRTAAAPAPVASPSPLPAASTPRLNPRMTTQLSPSWLESVMTPRRKHSRVPSHTFFLVTFNDSTTPPNVRAVTDYSGWPTYTFPSFDQLGFEGDIPTNIQAYFPGQQRWACVEVNSTQPLTKDGAIMVRRKNVPGFEEAKSIKEFFGIVVGDQLGGRPLEKVSLFRSDIANERSSVRKLIKADNQAPSTSHSIAQDLDDADDIRELSPDEVATQVGGKRKRGTKSAGRDVKGKGRMQTGDSVLELTDSESLAGSDLESDMPSISTMWKAKLARLTAPSVPAATFTPNPALFEPQERPHPTIFSAGPIPLSPPPAPPSLFVSPPPGAGAWPAGFTAVQIVNGFTELANIARGRSLPVEEQKGYLAQIYGCSVSYPTFREHRRFWDNAIASGFPLCQRVLNEDLPWNYFASRYREHCRNNGK